MGFREGLQKDEGGKDLLSRGMWDAAGSRGREDFFFFNLAPLLSQPPGAVPGTQPLLPNSMDPTRQQGKPSRGGSSTDAPNQLLIGDPEWLWCRVTPLLSSHQGTPTWAAPCKG